MSHDEKNGFAFDKFVDDIVKRETAVKESRGTKSGETFTSPWLKYNQLHDELPINRMTVNRRSK